MEKVRKNGGFIMVEVMIGVMLVLFFTCSLLSASKMEYQRNVETIRKREMYYTGLSAVRLMAMGIANDEYVYDEGIQEMNLVFESEFGTEKVEVPIQLQIRKQDNKIIILAQGISLTLKWENSQWIPESYGFHLEDVS